MKIPILWLTCGGVDVLRKGDYLHGDDDTGQHWLLAVKPDDDCYCEHRLTAQLPSEAAELNKILIERDGLLLTGTRGDALRLCGM